MKDTDNVLKDLLEKSFQKFDLVQGSLVKANVLQIGKKWVTLDIGFKSDGLVPIEEFQNHANKIQIKEGDEVEIVLTFFDHDKKRLHFKMEMIEKSSKKLSATIEMLALYIDLSKRKVTEFEDEKIKIMDDFINENKNEFNSDNLFIIGKLKK